MKRLKTVVVAVFSLALTGCESWSIITSSKIEPSATDAEYSAVVPVDRDGSWDTLFGKDPTAENYRSNCVKAGLVAPAGAAVLTAIGSAAWDLGVMAVNDKVEKIQERSSSTWNATWTTTSDELKRLPCLALVRYRYTTTEAKGTQPESVTVPQMILLLKLTEFDPKKDKLAAVQFVPMLAASRTSAALTKDEGKGLGKIGLSAAGAISYYVDGELKESMPDAISVSGVTVGETGSNPPLMVKSLGYGGSNATKPVTYPFDSKADKHDEPGKYSRQITPLYVKFAVAETGTLSGKNAKAKAEIKVITDALGPVAKDFIKKRFEDDDSQ
ncbi:hypothetical protein NPS46_00765 [Pseudomonas putida]|uniref:hypothetical protein n=1 Tax=Pseudomonas putida TaxID=303 RepID=UPI00236472F0|nr:hypothetical protein [Pseudomonas putida]MDD2051081.1 hypothetical protein [Pseudomonas putida]